MNSDEVYDLLHPDVNKIRFDGNCYHIYKPPSLSHISSVKFRSFKTDALPESLTKTTFDVTAQLLIKTKSSQPDDRVESFSYRPALSPPWLDIAPVIQYPGGSEVIYQTKFRVNTVDEACDESVRRFNEVLDKWFYTGSADPYIIYCVKPLFDNNVVSDYYFNGNAVAVMNNSPYLMRYHKRYLPNTLVTSTVFTMCDFSDTTVLTNNAASTTWNKITAWLNLGATVMIVVRERISNPADKMIEIDKFTIDNTAWSSGRCRNWGTTVATITYTPPQGDNFDTVNGPHCVMNTSSLGQIELFDAYTEASTRHQVLMVKDGVLSTLFDVTDLTDGVDSFHPLALGENNGVLWLLMLTEVDNRRNGVLRLVEIDIVNQTVNVIKTSATMPFNTEMTECVQSAQYGTQCYSLLTKENAALFVGSFAITWEGDVITSLLPWYWCHAFKVNNNGSLIDESHPTEYLMRNSRYGTKCYARITHDELVTLFTTQPLLTAYPNVLDRQLFNSGAFWSGIWFEALSIQQGHSNLVTSAGCFDYNFNRNNHPNAATTVSPKFKSIGGLGLDPFPNAFTATNTANHSLTPAESVYALTEVFGDAHFSIDRKNRTCTYPSIMAFDMNEMRSGTVDPKKYSIMFPFRIMTTPLSWEIAPSLNPTDNTEMISSVYEAHDDLVTLGDSTALVTNELPKLGLFVHGFSGNNELVMTAGDELDVQLKTIGWNDFMTELVFSIRDLKTQSIITPTDMARTLGDAKLTLEFIG